MLIIGINRVEFSRILMPMDDYFNAQTGQDIAQLHVTAARESHDVDLTFDRVGISRCDEVLETESLSDTLILSVGCYLGEVLCRTLDGATRCADLRYSWGRHAVVEQDAQILRRARPRRLMHAIVHPVPTGSRTFVSHREGQPLLQEEGQRRRTPPTEGGDLDYGRRDVRWQRRRGLEELFHPYNIAGALPVVVRAAHRRLNERLLGPGQSSRCLFRAPPEIRNVGFVHESSTLFGPHFTCPSHHAAPRRDLAAPLLDQAGTSGRSWPWPR